MKQNQQSNIKLLQQLTPKTAQLNSLTKKGINWQSSTKLQQLTPKMDKSEHLHFLLTPISDFFTDFWNGQIELTDRKPISDFFKNFTDFLFLFRFFDFYQFVVSRPMQKQLFLLNLHIDSGYL
eukprot:TRINITY_DN494_c0_g4_i1.p3 TRINITY_DN494_c0_g4~~TRINITY_DN494_c0_g4_i1.p3  ORF type:complete len:123 (+),score=3.08 TRINITY_DN494_c0_g4_i1:72-440(+)